MYKLYTTRRSDTREWYPIEKCGGVQLAAIHRGKRRTRKWLNNTFVWTDGWKPQPPPPKLEQMDLIWFFFRTSDVPDDIYIYIYFRVVTKNIVSIRTYVIAAAPSYYTHSYILLYYILSMRALCIISYKRVPTPPTVALYLLLYYIIYIEICVLTLYI